MSARTVNSKLRRTKLAASNSARCARAAHRALHVAELAILMAEESTGQNQTLRNHCAKAQDAAAALEKYSVFLAEAAASVVTDRRAVNKLTRRLRARDRRVAARK